MFRDRIGVQQHTVFVRDESVLTEVVMDLIDDAVAQLFLLFGQIAPTDNPDGDFSSQLLEELHHFRRGFTARDRQRPVDIEQRNDARLFWDGELLGRGGGRGGGGRHGVCLCLSVCGFYLVVHNKEKIVLFCGCLVLLLVCFCCCRSTLLVLLSRSTDNDPRLERESASTRESPIYEGSCYFTCIAMYGFVSILTCKYERYAHSGAVYTDKDFEK